MSDIALYNVLTKVGATPEEAERAVADVASSKKVATKTDLEKLEMKLMAKIKELMVEIKAIKWMFGLLFVINFGIFIKLFF